MKAFIISRYGNKDVVELGELPKPELGANDVLVEIHAASVNPVDIRIRDGKLKQVLPLHLPTALGIDFAGVVIRVGSSVERFKPGDEVYGETDHNRIGTFAEYVATHEGSVALKPSGLTMEEAAAMPMVSLTSWQVLVERGRLKQGQKVLIHAGSGGVGSIAIQLAKHLGATVATTASTANVEKVIGFGADIVIDYKKEDFETKLRDYDLVLDSVGGETLEKSLRVLKPGGQVISIYGPPDAAYARESGLSRFMQIAMGLLSFQIRRKAKRHDVSYSFLFMRPNGDQLREISSLIDSGIIRPTVDRVFPFESTREALAYVEDGHAQGKVVIKVR
jgi:NADPH:quinone reductase-like Zn-dependent oxidoreductase